MSLDQILLLPGVGGSSGIASDSFNRANSTTLGNTDSYSGGTAKAWTEQNGDFAISSNTLIAQGAAPAEPVWVATIDAGVADCTTAIDITLAINGSAGVVVRYSDNDNLWLVHILEQNNVIQLYRRETGAWNLVDSAAVTINASTAYRVQVVTSGTSITGTVDGANTVSATSSFNQSATKVGVRAGTTATFDNFIVS